MRRSYFLVAVLFVVTGALAAEVPEFQWMAEASGEFTSDAPVRIALPFDILSKSSASLADLRLFDNERRETPFAVAVEERSKQWRKGFGFKLVSFKVVSFKDDQGTSVVVLERPEEIQDVSRIGFSTQARDFQKQVKVEGSADQKAWSILARDTIFDFSSRVDLRRAELEIPSSKHRYYRVTLSDTQVGPALPSRMELKYEGLEFAVRGGNQAPFRIDHFSGASGNDIEGSKLYDRMMLTQLTSSVDEKKTTVFYLGEANLSLAELTIKVANPYYYRRVELWAAERNEEKMYRLLGSGVIFKIPHMEKPEQTLKLAAPVARHLQVRIINRDNPPLDVKALELAWLRRNLYFLPQTGRTYALYFGAMEVQAPDYEVGNMLSNDPGILAGYKEWRIGNTKTNPGYAPMTSRGRKAQMEKLILRGVILALVIGLGFWIYRLLRKTQPA